MSTQLGKQKSALRVSPRYPAPQALQQSQSNDEKSITRSIIEEFSGINLDDQSNFSSTVDTETETTSRQESSFLHETSRDNNTYMTSSYKNTQTPQVNLTKSEAFSNVPENNVLGNETDKSSKFSQRCDDAPSEQSIEIISNDPFSNVQKINTNFDNETFEGGATSSDYFDIEEKKTTDDLCYKAGYLDCWFRPTPCTGIMDWCRRTIHWLKINAYEIVGGVTTSINQVPEVIAYSAIAGIDPIIGLQSTWVLNMITSFIGGSPGMMSGLTGSVAIAIAQLIKDAGIGYVFYSVMLAGLFEVFFGVLGLGVLVRLIPHSVLIGFMDSVGIIIALAQLKYFKIQPDGTSIVNNASPPSESDESDNSTETHFFQVGNSYAFFSSDDPWVDRSTCICMIFMIMISFATCLILRNTKLPGALMAIVFGIIIEFFAFRNIGIETPLISDFITFEGQQFPVIIFFDKTYNLPPFNWQTIEKIYLCSITIFCVSLIESLMTVSVMDNYCKNNDTGQPYRNRNYVALAQGTGQFIAGLCGGVGGGAMVGPTMIHFKSDAFTNVSVFVASFFMFLIVTVASPVVDYVPLATLAGIMYTAVFDLIRWESFKWIISAITPESLRDRFSLNFEINLSDCIIISIVITLSILLNLTTAILVGVVIGVFAYSWNSTNRLIVEREVREDDDYVRYNIVGSLFFGTANTLLDTFSSEAVRDDPRGVILSLEGADILDWSGMMAIKELYVRIVSCGKIVAFSNINPTTLRLMQKNSSMWERVNFLDYQEGSNDDEECYSEMDDDGIPVLSEQTESSIIGDATYDGELNTLGTNSCESIHVDGTQP